MTDTSVTSLALAPMRTAIAASSADRSGSDDAKIAVPPVRRPTTRRTLPTGGVVSDDVGVGLVVTPAPRGLADDDVEADADSEAAAGVLVIPEGLIEVDRLAVRERLGERDRV